MSVPVKALRLLLLDLADAAAEAAAREVAQQMLWRAALPVLNASHAMLWPGRVEHRDTRATPLRAALRYATDDSGAPVIWLDEEGMFGRTPRTAPFATLSVEARALQLVAVSRTREQAQNGLRRLRAVSAQGAAAMWTDYDGGRHARVLTVSGRATAPQELGPGVVAVVGGTSSGKTTLVRSVFAHTAEHAEVGVVDWGEPVRAAAGRYTLQHLEEDIADRLSSNRVVLLVDSIKNLLLQGENLGSGGLSQAFQAQLSTIAAAAELSGVTIALLLNVLTMSKEVRVTMLKSLRGNVTSTISLEREEGGREAPHALVNSRLWPQRPLVAMSEPQLGLAYAGRDDD